MIKRLIQLVLDQAAAKRLEREINRSMGQIAKQTESKMSAAFKRVGGFLAAAFSVRAIGSFTKEMFRLGSAAEEVGSKFATVFGSEGAERLDAFLGKFAQVAGLTRTEGREMLSNFGAVFQGAGIAADASADLSEQMVQLAGDLQSFHNVPIEETFAALRSGATGEAEPLKRFGIVLRAVDVDARALANTGKKNTKELTEQERVLARVQLMYEKAGAAVGDLERTQGSTANRVRSLTTWFRQLREDLAVGLLPVFRMAVIEVGNASGLFDGLTGGVEALTRWIRENLSAIRDWGVVVVRTVKASVETLRFMARMVINAFDVVGSSLALMWAKVRQEFARTLNVIIESLNALPGVDIEFRMNQLTPAEFAEQQRLLMEGITSDAGDMADALGDLAQAYRDVGTAAVEAATGQREAAAPPPPAEFRAPPTSGDDEEAAKREAEEERQRQLAVSRRRQLQIGDAAAAAFRQQQLEATRAKAEATGEAMTAAFEGFFEASRMGWSDTGDVWNSAVEAARGAGASIVSALTEGRAEAEMAEGTAKLAAGIWPPNPAAFAASLKHFAAAALFRAIPGVVRGGGGGSGGGGAGSSIPRGALGTSTPMTRELPGTEVHVYMDPLSPADTRFQVATLGAYQQAIDRYGPNVRVKVHPHPTTRGA